MLYFFIYDCINKYKYLEKNSTPYKFVFIIKNKIKKVWEWGVQLARLYHLTPNILLSPLFYNQIIKEQFYNKIIQFSYFINL